jgi:hypothetical protein
VEWRGRGSGVEEKRKQKVLVEARECFVNVNTIPPPLYQEEDSM